MTESKRFVYNVNKNSIETSDGVFMAYVDTVDAVNIIEVMNSLSEENEKLKSEINMLKITIARNEAYIS